MNLIKDFEETFLRTTRPAFRIGDTVKVHLRIVEEAEESENGNGNNKKKKATKKETKERVQVFTGTVISKAGCGLSETFTLYRNAYGSSMERVFLIHSPKIAKIEVVRQGRVRRAKLNYIRGRAGKAAKIRERMGMFHHETPEITKRPAQEEVKVETEVDTPETASAPEAKTEKMKKKKAAKPDQEVEGKKPEAKKDQKKQDKE